MSNQTKTAILKTDFHTIYFEFFELNINQLIFGLKYCYGVGKTKFKGKSRRVYRSSKGKYFIFERRRVYFDSLTGGISNEEK